MSLATRLNSEFIHRLTVLIITFNEEANIDRALSALWWVPEILVVDSGSTDKTLSIISEYNNARVIYRKFDSFARQCNFGLENLDSEWVLSLDADYIVSSRLSEEISQKVLRPDDEDVSIHGFRIPFYYCIHGKPIRSGLLPPRTCLYRRTSAKYMDIGHGHRVIIDGKIVQLRNRIFHDDRKPIGVWLQSQQRYQQTEAYMLKSKKSTDLPVQDLLRKHTFLAPFAAFFMCLIIRRGFLDGKEGLIYAFHRFIAESLLYLYTHEY
jgi:glycosyltransferase involved in cell wall biosynthesis